MKTIAFFVATLLCATFGFAGLKPESQADEVLDGLYDVGKDLKSFTADVKLNESDLISQDTWTRGGKVWYQQKEEGDPRMRVSFETRVQDNVSSPQKIDYLLNKGWLIDRNYARKMEINRQVLRPGEKMNLLKLGEGPFPLPIGQKKEDVHRLFDVRKLDKATDDPADTLHIELTPKPGTQFERKFASINVWVDLNSAMPRRIQTVDKNQTMMRGTDLENIRLNAEINEADFKLPEVVGADWQRRDEAFEQ